MIAYLERFLDAVQSTTDTAVNAVHTLTQYQV